LESSVDQRVFSALISAWRVSLIASTLLWAALALAPFWGSAIYFEALSEALTSEPF
jgi:hypothetical protein